MGIAPRIKTSWASMRVKKGLSSRGSIIHIVVLVLLFSTFAYIIWLPIFYLFQTFQDASSHQKQPVILEPGDDALNHFIGSRDCGILQSDIYLAPWPTSPKTSPFCRNRATLFEALGGGGRHGFDEPYVGKECSYKWFSTPEICMILERFNSITFIGDYITESIYAAFNILLREDLALGGLKQWSMSEQDLTSCKCSNQFLNKGCLEFIVKSIDDVKMNQAADQNGSPYFCQRIPHGFIQIDSVPASLKSINLFKDLTYSRPNPWQPSPVIFSLSHGSNLDVSTTTQALDEWTVLARAAERNIPMLFLGPRALGVNKTAGTPPAEGNVAVWHYQEQMAGIAMKNYFDVLSLYNLTAQATSPDGEHYDERVALVEAMMVINWLSKLETS